MAKDPSERDKREREEEEAEGIECPFCGCADTSVWKTRPWNGKIRRQRLCNFCHEKFRTLETRQ